MGELGTSVPYYVTVLLWLARTAFSLLCVPFCSGSGCLSWTHLPPTSANVRR